MSEPYKKANRKFHPDDTVVDVGGHKIGGGYFAVMSGPCSVESKEQITYVAQRVQADFDNFRRRNEGVRADAFAEGQRKVATAMLPVLDNLERALAAAENADADALKTGVEMTRKQMVAAYEKLGVTPIDRLGEKFDPNLEEAIMQGTADDGEPGTVCMVLQKGYMMDKTVLRHAMVKVVPD